MRCDSFSQYILIDFTENRLRLSINETDKLLLTDRRREKLRLNLSKHLGHNISLEFVLNNTAKTASIKNSRPELKPEVRTEVKSDL